MKIGSVSTASIAASGLRASETRLEASAQNVANVSTERYDPVRAIDTAQRLGGVSSRIEGTGTSLSLEAFTRLEEARESRVEVGSEVVQQITAQRAYSANARVLETDASVQGEIVRTQA
jgi:flagellar basal body rod protein FlgG